MSYSEIAEYQRQNQRRDDRVCWLLVGLMVSLYALFFCLTWRALA